MCILYKDHFIPKVFAGKKKKVTLKHSYTVYAVNLGKRSEMYVRGHHSIPRGGKLQGDKPQQEGGDDV